MDFDIPKELADYLLELDAFIEREIKPLEEQDDNIRFFDHRREDARTDWERGGLLIADSPQSFERVCLATNYAGAGLHESALRV